MKKLLLFTLISWLFVHTSYAKSNEYEQKVEQSLKNQKNAYEAFENDLYSGNINSYDDFLKKLMNINSIHEGINISQL